MTKVDVQDKQEIIRATELTASNLRQLVTDKLRQNDTDASHLSVPDREELIELIAQILPAGNVTSFVLNSILNAKNRGITSTDSRMYISSLFKGLSILRDNAVYGMMFAGPATVLAGYNMLLKLAGVNDLPEGVWQFYVEFGLREDTARHQSETLGFNQAAAALKTAPTDAEMLTSWVLASMWLIRDYDHLLANVWEEQVRLTKIAELTGLSKLHRTWRSLTPYNLPIGQHEIGLSSYRRHIFDRFCQEQLGNVGAAQRANFSANWTNAKEQKLRQQMLRNYQKQLSIRSYLEPSEYNEKRVPIPASDLHIGIIHKECYYLLKLLDPALPTAPALIHKQVQEILAGAGEQADIDLLLTKIPRTNQAELRKLLSPQHVESLAMLRKAPILINWDQASQNLPLSQIRDSHRGVGDHTLTLFRTDTSMVFDFSHIFFDGPWAMAVAEMMTNEAIRHMNLRERMHATTRSTQSPIPLSLKAPGSLVKASKKFNRNTNNISAEEKVSITPIHDVRRMLANTTRPRIHVTVNDILVMYRSFFNQVYQPSPAILQSLDRLIKQRDHKALALAVLQDFQERATTNPSLLIPIDATQINPADRIFPSTFRNPLPDLHKNHQRTFELLYKANHKRFGKKSVLQEFQQARTEYLSMLGAFASVMHRYRKIATDGQSASTMAIRLIAGLPGSMQKLVDGIPGQFTVMNDAIKGEEVFSNVGQVAVGSSLSRFASAKDDNDKKILVWGIMTDNDSQLCISLRDFRPPITMLALMGHQELAQQITQDFLNSYVVNLMKFIQEFKDILQAPKA